MPIVYNCFPPPPPPPPALAPVPVPVPVPAPVPAPAPPVPANIPLLPVAAALPLACHPFNPNWEVHYMGRMDVVCEYCEALHSQCEQLATSSQVHPKFGMCCYSGKVRLPLFENPPPELLDLLTRQDEVGRKFRDHIRNYNNALAMTSLGCDQDKNINRDGGGPYVFKVHGHLYHQSGSLIPNQGRQPIYSQLYIYDPQDALDFVRGWRHQG